MGERRRIFVGVAIIIVIVVLGYWYFETNKVEIPAKIQLEVPKQILVGEEISVPLRLSSTEAMNAAEFYFSFPKELVEVKEINTDNSIYALWVTDSPKFDNTTGTLSFEGGLPTPGFTGDGGLIATVVFKVLAAGSGEITLKEEKSQVLANDGLGTKIEAAFSPIKLEVND